MPLSADEKSLLDLRDDETVVETLEPPTVTCWSTTAPATGVPRW